MEHMTAQQLKTRVDRGDPPLLLDVREPWEHRLASIPGARLVPMGQIPAALNTLPQDQDIAVYCHLGVRSLHVARFLENQGFSRVINLTGGIDAWSREIDPGIPTY